LVVGFGVTGQAMVAALVAHGATVSVVDDHPASARAVAELATVDLVEAPWRRSWRRWSPGATPCCPAWRPDRHPVFAAARCRRRAMLSEFDLRPRTTDRSRPRTDGKTTDTSS
jgi:UDP-N-acetylmuramoylalanine-D-glutamate ligase